MVKKFLLFFFTWKTVTFLLAYLATFLISNAPTSHSYEFDNGMPFFVKIWGNFDGCHYMAIAKRGYSNFQQGFFPLYPIFIRSFTAVFRTPLIISGQIISNLSFITSLFVINKILINDKKKKLFNLLVLIIIFFPTSFFYGAVYNDSLFLLLATLVIYFARKKSWLLASISGALATLTRLNGLALFIFLFFEYVLQKKQLKFSRMLKDKFYFIVLIPLSFLAYLGYIQIKFGDWNLLFSTMKIWGQDKIVFLPQIFWRYFKIIVLYPTFEINYWVAVFELLMVIFYIFLLFYSYKKIRLSYWIFFVLSILIPSLTGTFQGMPRYGLHLFPMYLSLSLFLENRGLFIKFLYFTISIVLLIFALTLFTRGYFVA